MTLEKFCVGGGPDFVMHLGKVAMLHGVIIEITDTAGTRKLTFSHRSQREVVRCVLTQVTAAGRLKDENIRWTIGSELSGIWAGSSTSIHIKYPLSPDAALSIRALLYSKIIEFFCGN